MMKTIIICVLCLVFLGTYNTAPAGLSATEIDRLGKDLTPLGAEKSANADGTIPAWNGGITTAFPGWPNKDNYRPNPYSEDKILFTITKDNMAQYADNLPEAAKAMLEAYPDAFKMNIYPTRRTAGFPQWYYDAIRKNAATATLVNDGNGVEGVFGSIPFPIPKSGNEVIWNHMLRFQGVTRTGSFNTTTVYANGSRSNTVAANIVHYPFYDPDISEQDWDGTTIKYSETITAPARDAGEGLLALENIDPVKFPRKAWQYDPGERRVRRAPNLAFDTPDEPLNVIDDYDLFSGSPERYDWTLVGKKEMYVPYNNNEVNSPLLDRDASTPPGFIDPDILRYELHRVWVVEATLKQNKRHLYAKRVFYVDEDTWNILVSDKYDNNGNLWRLAFAYPLVAPETPLTGSGSYVHVDIKTNGYVYVLNTLGLKGWDLEQPPPAGNYFTPAALRRRGR